MHQSLVVRNTRWSSLIGGIAIIVLLAGCSSAPKKTIKLDEARVKAFAQHGYDSGIDYEISFAKAALEFGNEFIQLGIVQSKREGKYPVVIYLPGLGESSDAGKEMRSAWAKSGYVVLSVQPLKEDEDIWSSDAARRADFSYIRQERYSSNAISNRLNTLRKLMESLNKRINAGDELFQHMDMSQLAIVGFDVGASSAMIASGEEVPNVPKAALPFHPQVVIALSPHAEPPGPDIETRYQNIDIPVLSVTSDADDETHGNEVTSLHQLPFQHMLPGNKFLLLLAGASHSLIGGGAVNDKSESEAQKDSKQTEQGYSDGQASRGQGRHGRTGSNNKRGEGASFRQGGERSPTQRAEVKVAIEQVTTAFLNAYVKKDRFSIEWLNQYAQPWLYGIGQLQEK